MLFNSAIFIFAFLPVTACLYFLSHRLFGSRAAIALLVAASLAFYSWWSPVFLVVLLVSISLNAILGVILVRSYPVGLSRRSVLLIGLLFNLGLLGYFKYAGFIVSNWNEVFKTDFNFVALALPLGISFFTFQKIAFLVDAYRGEVRNFSLLNYALFVTFFPQLIAGPIVHHAEVIPQFERPDAGRVNWGNIAIGTSLFAIGLFMKVVIADGVSRFCDPVFSATALGAPRPAEAWVAALAYAFQLYFDFNGYSVMALGLARIFNIVLPLNFFSPYKSANIIEFWQRWHMTLSRFLRDYLYIPLGGNRHGQVRRYLNLFLTMLLGGLWHGAGWTFVLWGALHGAFLIVNYAWQAAWAKIGWRAGDSRFARAAATGVTFLAVVIAWVPFRAPNLDRAWTIWQSMAGRLEQSLASSLIAYVSAFGDGLIAVANDTTYKSRIASTIAFARALSESSLLWLAAMSLIVFLMPNCYEVFRDYKPALVDARVLPPMHGSQFWWRWQPSRTWAAVVSVLLVLGLLQLSRLSPFLYFQF